MPKVGDPDPARTVTISSAPSPDTGAIGSTALPVVEPEHYELLGEVARGGIGRIIKARDRQLKREVALKQLRDDRTGHGRLVREAMLTARLQHPSIIPVYQIGQFATGVPFYAMKLVHGQSLRDAIDARPTLDQRLELLSNVLAVADAIAYAHSERVIHRDLKPSNVLIGAFGETVVVDWGLGKDLDAPEVAEPSSHAAPVPADVTATGVVLGTPAYMSPEQALGEPVDQRSDVYALGALLYHVLAGVRPYAGDSNDIVHAVATTSPRPLAEIVPGVPPELAAIVACSMARTKEKRYTDASGFAADLRRFQLGQVPHADVPAQATEIDDALEAELEAELRREALRPTRAMAALALTLLPLFGVIEAVLAGTVLTPMFVVRCIVIALVAALLWASYRPFAQRWSFELALGVVVAVSAMLIALDELEHLAVGFTASIMLVLLGSSTLLRMPSRKLVPALAAIVVGFAIVRVASGGASSSLFIQQVTLFAAGVAVAWVGIRQSLRLRRAEFYARRRLELANLRLAKLSLPAAQG